MMVGNLPEYRHESILFSLVPRPLPVFQLHAENERGPGMSSHVIGQLLYKVWKGYWMGRNFISLPPLSAVTVY